jgi:uncharacterized SAM-binding protein YcdF (DUF218 family)
MTTRRAFRGRSTVNMRRAGIVLPVILVAGVFARSERTHRRASTSRLGDPAPRPGREAILVLGFGNRGVRANSINRYRVRVALRSIDPRASDTVLVFCGGAVHSAVPEADLLLRYARDERGYTGPYILERESTTTRENIRNTVDILEDFDTVRIASNTLHAERARAYLWMLRPDLGRRLARAQDYRFGEIPVVKIAEAVRVAWSVRRRRRG